jgi:ketosteroid isomerase-like protein
MNNAAQTNLAPLRRYIDAWLAGDFPGMLATYADDFILHWYGDNPFAGTKSGKQAAVEALMAFTQKTDRKLLGIVDVMAGPERAIAVVREQITAAAETRDVERVLVYRVENDLLAECWVYDQDQRFIDRALSA